MGWRKVRHLIVTVTIAVGAASFAMLDAAYTPIVVTSGTNLGRRDQWTFKHGSKCVFSLETGLGPTTDTTSDECRSKPWHVGQSLELRVRRGRITGWLFVYGGLGSQRGPS